MTRNQLLLWGSVGAVVGLGVGWINGNIPVWMTLGIAMGLAMCALGAKFDPESRG